MSINEFSVEDASLTWFWELGYTLGHGLRIELGEPAADRDSFGNEVARFKGGLP